MTTATGRPIMGKLENLLRSHDWSYEYSDDSRAYNKGKSESEVISGLLRQLNSPFYFIELRGFVFDLIVEKFTEVEPGQFKRTGEERSCVAPVRKVDLITQAKSDEIRAWLDTNDIDRQ